MSTLEAEGIAAGTTGEGIGLTSLVSSAALIALFGAGLVATAGRHISRGYLIIAGVALALVVCVAAIALVVGAVNAARKPIPPVPPAEWSSSRHLYVYRP